MTISAEIIPANPIRPSDFTAAYNDRLNRIETQVDADFPDIVDHINAKLKGRMETYRGGPVTVWFTIGEIRALYENSRPERQTEEYFDFLVDRVEKFYCTGQDAWGILTYDYKDQFALRFGDVEGASRDDTFR